MAESHSLMTSVKIPVDNNNDLIPSDDEEDPDHPVDLLQVSPGSLPLPSDTDEDEDEDDIVLKIPSSRRKLKTPTGRRKRTLGKPKLDNKKKPGNSNKNPDNHDHDVELRLRNLEEVTHQIGSTLASQSAEPILNENIIEEIVACKIEERLKDLKTQHKNAISVLSKEVNNLQQQIENQVSGLKKEIDMKKTRTANTNDHCGRLEKAVKFTERQLLKKIDMMKDELLSELKNDLGLD